MNQGRDDMNAAEMIYFVTATEGGLFTGVTCPRCSPRAVVRRLRKAAKPWIVLFEDGQIYDGFLGRKARWTRSVDRAGTQNRFVRLQAMTLERASGVVVGPENRNLLIAIHDRKGTRGWPANMFLRELARWLDITEAISYENP